MAVVRLSDVIIPEVYASYGEVNNPELTAFLSSGIVAMNPQLNAYAEGPSKTGHVPYWLDLDQTVEPNYSNDDPADLAETQKLGMGELAYRKSYLNQGWSDMDLVKELMGADPMAQIKKRTSTYWLRQLQRRIVAMARGLWLKNVASNGGDMTIDVSTQDGAAATPANRMNSDALINAAFTMGDSANGFSAIALHSHVAAQLTKNDDIETIRDSDGVIVTRTYKGLTVVMDDNLPVIAGTTSGFRYLSVLFAPGAIGMGVGTPTVPVEMNRIPEAGNGGGQEKLWERKTWLLHPAGFSWVEGSLAEMSPSLADLAMPSHWVRAYARKQIPMAFIITN